MGIFLLIIFLSRAFSWSSYYLVTFIRRRIWRKEIKTWSRCLRRGLPIRKYQKLIGVIVDLVYNGCFLWEYSPYREIFSQNFTYFEFGKFEEVEFRLILVWRKLSKKTASIYYELVLFFKGIFLPMLVPGIFFNRHGLLNNSLSFIQFISE